MNVKVGASSYIGWISAFLALLPVIVKSVEEGSVAFNGPEKWLAIAGIAIGLVTQIGRYVQAHALIKNPPAA